MVREVDDPKQFDTLASHITQSWEWGEFREQTSSIKKVLRLGSYEDRTLTKVWQILFSKVPYLPSYSVAYLPRGLLPSEKELAEIIEFCRGERAIFLKFEPFDSLRSLRASPLGFVPGKPVLPQHTIYVDLTLSEEELLAQMHEKTRYNVRLAQKKGVTIKEEGTPNALDNFIKLLILTESRQGFYSHYPDYYRKLWTILQPSKMVYLLNAYVDNKAAAGIMLFHFKDFLYYPYGGSDPEFRQYMAPNLLHFEAMKLGKRLGCKTYDLWGSYRYSKTEKDPWWGIYRFKSGFGGKEVDFPDSFDVPLSPFYGLYTWADNFRWKLLRLKKLLS